MANVTMKLSAKEAEVIQKLREEAERFKQIRQLTKDLLWLSEDYARWIVENGSGNTYSTFCDDYGYREPPFGLPCAFIHRSVTAIMQMANELAFSALSRREGSE